MSSLFWDQHLFKKSVEQTLASWLIDSSGVMCDQLLQKSVKIPSKRPHLALLLHFNVALRKCEPVCGWARRAKGLCVILAFLHMHQDGPKPQALTQAVVPELRAKVYCEEYSCSSSRSAPFGFIAGEHKVLRERPSPERAQTDTLKTAAVNQGKQWLDKNS